MTEKTGTGLQRLFFWGRPFAPLYSLLMAIRSSFYLSGVLKQHQLEVPVISVGNLVVGGTGKTPMVHYIAGLLQQQGRKVAVLSRGYKGTAADAVNIVSNTTGILLDAAAAGDEPRLLAEKLPGIPVLTGRRRFAAGRLAIDSFGAEILILDDGFQHLSLQRDLDLVLFRAPNPLGNRRVLPGGELREPLSALKRAGAFVVTGMENSPHNGLEDFTSFLARRHPDKPRFTAHYVPDHNLLQYHHHHTRTIARSDACKMPLYGFCGIAVPESFKMTLERSSMKLTGFTSFGDHHEYSMADVTRLLDHAAVSGAQGLITTEKDMVKLRPLLPPDMPLLVQPVRLRFREDFDSFLSGRLAEII